MGKTDLDLKCTLIFWAMHIVYVLIKMSVPRWRALTGTFYARKVLKKVQNIHQKPPCSSNESYGLHCYAPTHKSSAWAFWSHFHSKQKVTVLPNPMYAQDLVSCDIVFFLKLKCMFPDGVETPELMLDQPSFSVWQAYQIHTTLKLTGSALHCTSHVLLLNEITLNAWNK